MKKLKMLRLLLCFVLLFIAMVILESCGRPQQLSSLKSLESFSYPSSSMRLGYGFQRRLDRPLFTPCIKGHEIYEERNGSSEVQFLQDMETSEYLDSVSGSVGGKASTIGVKASGFLDVLQFFQSHNTKSSFHLMFKIKKASAVLAPETIELTTLGEEILRKEPENFSRVCGDSYVAQINYGALFYAQLVFDFVSREQKDLLSGSLKASLGMGGFSLASGSGSMVQDSHKNLDSVVVSIDSFQYGGNPENLARILNANITHCTLNDLDPCRETYNKLTLYARTDLITQLTYTEKLSPVSVATYAYEDVPSLKNLAIKKLETNEAQEEKASRILEQLNLAFIENLSNRRRAQYILSYYDFKLSAVEREELQKILGIMITNEQNLTLAAKLCIRGDNHVCLEEGLKTLDGLQKYKTKLLESLDFLP